MKKAMVRPILVRGVATFALLGTFFGIAAQSANAAPNAVKVFVRTNGSDAHSCLGAAKGKACRSVSHAVGVADAISAAETPPASTPVIVEVKKGTYFDTTNNAVGGPATTPAGISITENNITIQRQGGGQVNIVPQSTEAEAGVLSGTQQNVLVNVASGTTGATLKNINISGADAQNSFTACSQDYVGVYLPNSSGTLNTVQVTNVQQPAGSFGCQPGANGSVYAVANTGTQVVTLSHVTANTYDKNGITCNGTDETCHITNSTVTGQGATNDNAQNGIEVAFGGSATIASSNVSNNAYTCNGVDDGACASASGILGYQDTSLSISNSTATGNDVNIALVADGSPVNITGNTVSNATDAAVGSGQGIEEESTTEGLISANHITGNQGGGIANFGTTGGTIAGNTITGNSGNVNGTVGPVCATVAPCEVGGGVIDAGTTGGTINGSNNISSNDNGGVVLQGSTGGTVDSNTISNNAAGGVVLQAAFGATVSNNTLTSNAAGGVFGEDPPPGTAPCTSNPMSSPCQNSGNSITGNTIGGTSGAGVELELTGGDSITGNDVSGLGEGGEGFILVGSDNNTVSTNNVSSSAAGVVITGNDLTGPSTNNSVSNNNFSGNLLGGAAVDGFGSPESWNKPGTGNQGVQGEVFFQSGIALTPGPTNGDGSPEIVTTPTSFSGAPGAFSSVVQYLAGAGAICGQNPPGFGGAPGVPVDGQVLGGNPSLFACTDGVNIEVTGFVASPVAAGNGEATGPSTTSEPGCESSPPPQTGEPSCTGDVLTMSDLPFINTVAQGNTLTSNVWNNETIAGAIDGSGPNGQLSSASPPFVNSDPTPPANIQNTWTSNTGSPANSAANPTTANPAAGS